MLSVNLRGNKILSAFLYYTCSRNPFAYERYILSPKSCQQLGGKGGLGLFGMDTGN